MRTLFLERLGQRTMAGPHLLSLSPCLTSGSRVPRPEVRQGHVE